MPEPMVGPGRPFTRLFVRAALIIAAILALVVLALHTPWGMKAAVNLAFRVGNPLPGAELAISGARGGFLSGIELHGIRLRGGAVLVSADVDTLTIRYRLHELLGAAKRVREVHIAGPDVVYVRPSGAYVPSDDTADFTLDWFVVRRGHIQAQLFQAGRDSVLRVDDLNVSVMNAHVSETVSLAVDTLSAVLRTVTAPVVDLRLAASATLDPDHLVVRSLTVDGAHTRISADGTLGLPTSEGIDFDGADFHVRFDPLSGADVGRFLPIVGDPGDIVLAIDARGDSVALDVDVDARAERGGHLSLDAQLPARDGEISVESDGRIRGLDLGAILGGRRDSLVVDASWSTDIAGADLQSLTGPFVIDLAGSRAGTFALDRARFEGKLEGGRVAMDASVVTDVGAVSAEASLTLFGEPFAYEVSGRATIPPARAEPGGPVVFAGAVPFDVRGAGTKTNSATASVAIELIPDASAEPLVGEGRLQAELESGVARWQMDAVVASGAARARGDIALTGENAFHVREGELDGVRFAAFAADTTHSRLDARFSAQGQGTELDAMRATARLTALSAEYDHHEIHDVSATLRLEEARANLDADAVLDSMVVNVRASLAPLANPADARINLAFRELDLALVTGDTTLASRIGGHVDLRIAGPRLMSLLGESPDSRVIERTRGSIAFELEPSDVAGRQLDLAEIRGQLARGVLDLEGRLESAFGSLRLDGTARPFDPAPTAELECRVAEVFDLAGALGLEGEQIDVRGGLTVHGVGADPETGELNVLVNLGGSRIRDLTLDPLTVRADYLRGALETRVQVRAGEDSVTALFAAQTLLDPVPVRCDGSIRFTQWDALHLVDSLEAGLGMVFEIDGAVPRSAELQEFDIDGWIGATVFAAEARADSVNIRGRLRDGMASFSRLAIDGNVLHARGQGQIALPGANAADSTSFELEAFLIRVEHLARVLGQTELAAASGRLQVHASGPSQRTRFVANARVRHPHFGQVWADSVGVALSGTLKDAKVADAQARISAGALVPWPLLARDAEVELRWDGSELDADIRSTAEGNRRQDLRVRIRPDSLGIRGDLDYLHLEGQTGTVQLQKPVEFEFGRRAYLSELVLLADGTPRIRVYGLAERDSIAFEAQLDSLDLARLQDLVELTTVGGSLDVDLSLSGTRHDPRLDGAVLARIIAGNRKPARLDGRLTWADSALDVSMSFDQSDQNRLAFTSHVPVALDLEPPRGANAATLVPGDMHTELRAEKFDLSWFEPLVSRRVLRRPRGYLTGYVVADGDPRFPTQSGSLSLDGGEVELPALGVRYRKAQARLVFDDRTIRLEQARVQSGGSVEARGSFTFRGPADRTVDLEATIRRFVAMNTLRAKLELDGTVSVQGDLHGPDIRADLTPRDTKIYAVGGEAVDLETVRLSLQDRLDLRERFGIRVDLEEEEQSYTWADSTDVDVTVTVGDNVWISRRSDPVVSLELEGEVRARKPRGGELDLRGSMGIRTGRSFLSFVGRRFDIVSAQIYMPGPLDSTRLELEAFHAPTSATAADVNVTANVTVDASGIVTDLRSEPFMEPSALLNYLATGQVEGGVESGTAYGLAVGSALGAVGGVAGRRLGLDVVRVTMDAYGGQTLAAGSYIDPRLYLGFRQPVVEQQTSRTGLTSGSTPTEFEVEVSATRNLLINLQGSSTQYRFLLRPRLRR